MLRKEIRTFFRVLIAGLVLPAYVQAESAPQEADAARELLTEAVEYYQENGDKALAVFSRQGPFVKDDLYVYVVNTNGIMLASGGPSVMLTGRDIYNAVDDDLKKKFEDALSLPESDTIHEGEYPWSSWNTAGREITKHVYYQRVEDKIFVVGYYQPRASSEDALKLLDTAVEAVRADPRETFKAVNALDPRFYKDDLYVFVVELENNRFVAHGSNLRLVGRDFSQLTDITGKPFGKEAVDKIAKSDTAEFNYQWKHPISGDVESKHAYARKVDDYLVVVGYYQPGKAAAE
ncbi:cache domain-containing protein [Pseudomonas saliphila]|uniref:cache domain-containing protein n=1 Tax=Pseudomonas saliphila TaxID=2586906 RepID=UPI00123B95C1|nr:cache domain-containing protein [Pseudomonas saliphila]